MDVDVEKQICRVITDMKKEARSIHWHGQGQLFFFNIRRYANFYTKE